jgi:hypothetical protein
MSEVPSPQIANTIPPYGFPPKVDLWIGVACICPHQRQRSQCTILGPPIVLPITYSFVAHSYGEHHLAEKR